MSRPSSEDIIRERRQREAAEQALAASENARTAAREEQLSRQALAGQLDVTMARAKELLDAAQWPNVRTLHRRNRNSFIAAIRGDSPVDAVSIGTIYCDGETRDPVTGWLATDGLIYAHDQWSHYKSVYLLGQPSWILENVISGLNNLINRLQNDKPAKSR